MKIAFYKGRSRIFNYVVSVWTRGPYSHAEALFEGDLAGEVYCASSSFLDHGVRFKTITLNPENWDVIDVPAFDTATARAWFNEHNGDPYDVWGLLSVLTPVQNEKGAWYCTEALAASVQVDDPWRWDPNRFACLSLRMPGSKRIALDGTSVIVD